jgi:hypothetical protein
LTFLPSRFSARHKEVPVFDVIYARPELLKGQRPPLRLKRIATQVKPLPGQDEAVIAPRVWLAQLDDLLGHGTPLFWLHESSSLLGIFWGVIGYKARLIGYKNGYRIKDAGKLSISIIT